MDDYARAAVLGLVQALTEFLPISSSAHLALAPRVMGERSESLTFDVALHLGTLTAVLAYFWRDYAQIAYASFVELRRHGPRVARWHGPSRLGVYLAAATVPAVVIGGLFNDVFEDEARAPWLIGVLLIVFGVVLWVADRRPGTLTRLASITLPHALVVGSAQALALVPGVSRSGATLTAGRLMGFDRETAARFSFLLSGPVVLAAATYRLGEAVTGEERLDWGPLIVGIVVSAVAGMAVIRWLLGYLRGHSVGPFVWYRVALGVAVLVAAALGWW